MHARLSQGGAAADHAYTLSLVRRAQAAAAHNTAHLRAHGRFVHRNPAQPSARDDDDDDDDDDGAHADSTETAAAAAALY